MIEAILIIIAVVLIIGLCVGLAVHGVLDRINTTLAVQAAVQLAYLKHAENEDLQAEAAAIQLDLLVRSGAINVVGKPEGEVDPDGEHVGKGDLL